MKILDRYLLKNFLIPLSYCLFVFCLLYVVIDVFGHLDEILRNNVPFVVLVKYYLSLLPLVFVQTVPVATLLAVVYMIGTMNRSNELTALKASGINISSFLLPVFAIAISFGLSPWNSFVYNFNL